MTLPEIVLPKVTLPFDIPVLLHPFVVHFLLAIPVVVLLLELMNLMMKKKAVGGVSFFLLLLTVFAAIGAYFTGLVDGKEAYPALSEAAKTALGEHKLLGIYLMLASGAILLFKLLAMTGNKVLKALYMFALIGFVVVMFKQGKEGGELVYEHGLNVQAVKTLDDKIFDLEESLEELEETVSNAKKDKASLSTQVQSEEASTPRTQMEVSHEKSPVTLPSQHIQTPVEGTEVERLSTPVQSEKTVNSNSDVVSTPSMETVSTPEMIPSPQ